VSNDQIAQEQEDFYQRLKADSYLLDVPGLAEHKGVTEDDINQALSTLNANGSGSIGVLWVVLMPTLVGENPDAPGPRYSIQLTVQVIDQPLLNSIGKTGSQVAERIREVLHRFSTGLGSSWYFSAMEPGNADVGKVSYLVKFKRVATDIPPPKAGRPTIAPAGGVAPQLVTLANPPASAGATIRYTLDGSLPTSANPAAVIYSAPFNVVSAGLLRVTAELAGYLQSDVSQATFT
jgi:hypothetical protein